MSIQVARTLALVAASDSFTPSLELRSKSCWLPKARLPGELARNRTGAGQRIASLCLGQQYGDFVAALNILLECG